MFIAKVVNGEQNWNKGAFPNNIGDKYYVTSIEDLYILLKNNGPLYALYDDARPDVKVSHMVLVTGVNVTQNRVSTNNPWGKIGNQTFEEFLTSVAWDKSYSYDFELSGVYTIR